MRRADRLFEIIQILRRRPTTRARDIAETLEISERTVYRDIRDLMASGVPIEGEAGVGYVLRDGFDLPPLMFKESEIEALVLGARIVESWADAELADAATDAIAKIRAVVPERLRGYMAETALVAPAGHFVEPLQFDLGEMRRAVRGRIRIRFGYVDAQSQPSRRVARPLSLAYFGPIWVLAAWCELREDFRCFRLDRMRELELLDRFRSERGKTLRDFIKLSRGWSLGRYEEGGVSTWDAIQPTDSTR